MSRDFPVPFETPFGHTPSGAPSQVESTDIGQQSLETPIFDAQTTPIVVTLCGSTRFMDDYNRLLREETLAGKIVLTVGCDTHSEESLSVETKVVLDELHLRKIDLSDEILVINKGGVIGESTKREIQYATDHGKEVRYMEQRFWSRISKVVGKINPRQTQGNS
jgi:hypothetical protein